jgi:hypothetical protein
MKQTYVLQVIITLSASVAGKPTNIPKGQDRSLVDPGMVVLETQRTARGIFRVYGSIEDEPTAIPSPLDATTAIYSNNTVGLNASNSTHRLTKRECTTNKYVRCLETNVMADIKSCIGLRDHLRDHNPSRSQHKPRAYCFTEWHKYAQSPYFPSPLIFS